MLKIDAVQANKILRRGVGFITLFIKFLKIIKFIKILIYNSIFKYLLNERRPSEKR